MKYSTTKPYLIRAIYEWCVDNELTAYISVVIDQNISLPKEYTSDGEITLNISPKATRDLLLGNDVIQFTARFNEMPREVSIPISAIKAIFAKEINQGLFFSPEIEQELSSTLKDENMNFQEPGSNICATHKHGGDRVNLKNIK
ncbi:ClpXP protease specificity-enhancing factor [Nitrosomonas sp. Nm33]|uniref:ClpXP protease specificity-enhancing factor n=1 Tax=Nitrosomonas sp. Nm33 TaxID=133724 RepID=UPI0008983619|nr:ClpXP protease specificity-enhancing factor [Nitrosomonas sp. Nm33]SDX96855.1 stringent starvation protein B [Nitrosomonas sp. Nm33]